MKSETRLKLAIIIATIFMLVEIVGGYIAESLAIYSDAAHLLSDIAGFAIALYAATASKRPKCNLRTFGYDRAEVLGALCSIFFLWIVTLYLLFLAAFRAIDWFIGKDVPINGKVMFYTAVFGVFVNIVLIYVFHAEHGGLTHCHDHGNQYEMVSPSEGSCSGNHDIEDSLGHQNNHDHSHSGQQVASYQGQNLPANSNNSNSSISNELTPMLPSRQSHDHSHEHGHNSIDHDHSNHQHNHKVESNHNHDHSHGHGHDSNVAAAALHVLTDMIQSIGVAIAGALVWWKPNWQIADPLCTLMFSLLVMYSTLPLFFSEMNILMEGAPAHVSTFYFAYLIQ